MNNLKHIATLYIVIALLVSTITIMNCSGDKVPDKIVIPEKEGVLKDSLPVEVKNDTTYLYKLRDTIIKYYNPVDTIYIKEYIKSTETDKTKKYIDAIGQRKYENTVENDDIRIKYDALTEGKLLDIKFDYLIKEKTFDVPKSKKEFLGLYGGFGLQTTTDINKLDITVGGAIQINDKHLIGIDYGLESKSIHAGYKYKFGSFKK